MTKKFRLLLLDANIVIELFRLGIWGNLVDVCDIHLSRIVADREAQFFRDEDGQRHDFDLTPYEEAGQINVFGMTPSDLTAFLDKFDPVYFEKLDPGEAESLAFLLNSEPDCKLCSADKIVFRVLGNLHLAEQGISLEEILAQTGLARPLRQEFSKTYRELWTRKGFEERLQGIGLRQE